MLEKVELSCVPRAFTVAMIAIEMPAAIRPYSIAVAPLSSFTKRSTKVRIGSPEVVAPDKEDTYLLLSLSELDHYNCSFYDPLG